jgi:hypothetical protein
MGGEIGECCPLQNGDGRITHLGPHGAQAAPDLHRARLRLMTGGTLDRRQLTLEDAHDALQGDVGRVVIQPVAARWAPLRPDNPGIAQLHEDLLHERLRYRDPPGEVLGV